jgi:PilZ domain
MQPSPGPATSAVAATPTPERRVRYRHPIHSLVYVNLDEGNGGIIRNLSEDGAAIQAVAALQPNQFHHMCFDLLSPRIRIEVRALVTWANPSGQAGLRFTDMSHTRRRLLNDWVLVNLLRRIEQACPEIAGPVDGRDLVLSASARPAIHFPPASLGNRAAEASVSGPLSLNRWPRPMSARTLARLIDGLVLFSAVLVFLSGFLAITETLPAWPVTLGLAVGVFAVFAALYRYLFRVIGCGTAGVHLARMAIGEQEQPALPRPETRFR